MTIGACEREPPRGVAPSSGSGAGGEGGEGGSFNPIDEEGCVPEGACGDEVRKVNFAAPNIYFVFDRSGSMNDSAGNGSIETRFTAVRNASIDMVKSLGTLINIGAAVFPGTQDVCGAGGEVMEITPGDPKSEDGSSGPATETFETRTNGIPNGGTPISATMTALTLPLAEAKGKTVVLLLTDGGPNCNAAATCSMAECQPVVEGTCPVGDNCCAPGYPGGGPLLCIDRPATVAAVAAVAALGMEVYVIGIPGSEVYADVLDEMAVAGGTAQAGTPQYHQVTDLDDLGDLFGSIAADAISCELPLSDTPTEEDKMFTNVYLDCELLPFDPIHGWTWLGEDTVWLHGDACEKLKTGGVAEVHIAIGCPTEVPK